MTKTKRPAKSFANLTKTQQRAVAGRIVRAVKALANFGPRYKVVNSPDIFLRDRPVAETTSEDAILTYNQRCRMLDMARNLARNSSTACSILRQFDLQGVGTTGGKATFTFENHDSADAMREMFAAWTRDADFYDGMPFNTVLKTILKTYLLGGDMVLLFDDGLVEDSGRLMIFEPDEIGDISPDAVRSIYGDLATQSQGRIKNANGRTIGVVVSRHERGKALFDVSRCYTLSCDPNAPALECPWLMPRNVFRKNQGRGVAPFAPSIATISDLEDLTNYELQAAKKNSQTLAQVINSGADQPELPSAFESGTDFSSMTDAELDAAVEAEKDMAEEVVTLDQIKGAGAIYEVMPDGHKLELLDTKHPNPTMPEFIRWLAGRSAAPFGLGSVYATLKADASYTAFRGEQVMSQPAFEDAQKFLEGICDWVIFRWAKWNERRGTFAALDLPANWLRRVSWQWPKMREVNQVDEQNAIQLKLKNGTGSYAEIYGADWKERLAQIGEEIEFCKAHGLPHPALQTASGALIETNNETTEVSNDR